MPERSARLIGAVWLLLVLTGCEAAPSPVPSRPHERPSQLAGLPDATGLPGIIAYNDVNGDIWVVNPDGSGRRRLTDSGDGLDYSMSWAPDGDHLVFRTTRGQRPPEVDSSIFVIDVDGSNERQLTSSGSGGIFPAWSPDGGTIAYTGEPDIMLVDLQGGPVRSLGVSGECSTWSPDGSRIMFCSNAMNRGLGVDNWDVFVMDADGTNVRQLTDDAARSYPSAWSPDGERIAFWSDRDGDGDVYIMNADGSDERQITDDPESQAVNAWLPDGSLVASTYEEGTVVGHNVLPDWYVMDDRGHPKARIPWLAGAMDPLAWLA